MSLLDHKFPTIRCATAEMTSDLTRVWAGIEQTCRLREGNAR